MTSPAEIISTSEKLFTILTDITESADDMFAVLQMLNILVQVKAAHDAQQIQPKVGGGRFGV